MADEFGISSLDYPANNKKKDIKPIDMKGGVKKEKQSPGKKFKEVFFCSSFGEVKNYIFKDLIVPSLKELLYNIVTGGLEASLFNQKRSRPLGGRKNNYTTIIDTPSYMGGSNSSPKKVITTKGNYDFSSLVFDVREDAAEVLTVLKEMADMYGVVSVFDLYVLCNIEPSYVDNGWGWKDLSTAYISHTRNGYTINFPRVGVI